MRGLAIKILRFLISLWMEVKRKGQKEGCVCEDDELGFRCAGLEISRDIQETCPLVAGVYRSREKSGWGRTAMYMVYVHGTPGSVQCTTNRLRHI